MMTVRFPNGFSVQYNDARYISNGVGCHRLLTESNGKLIARVPLDAIVELVAPCRMYNALHEDVLAMMQSEVAALRKEIRLLRKGVKP